MSSHKPKAFRNLYEAVVELLRRNAKYGREGVYVAQPATQGPEVNPVFVGFDLSTVGLNDLSVRGTYFEFVHHRLLVVTNDYNVDEETGEMDISRSGRRFPDEDQVSLTVTGILSRNPQSD